MKKWIIEKSYISQIIIEISAQILFEVDLA